MLYHTKTALKIGFVVGCYLNNKCKIVDFVQNYKNHKKTIALLKMLWYNYFNMG